MAYFGFAGGEWPMKCLVLWALGCLTEPVTLGQLSEVVMVDEKVIYFEFVAALDDLVTSGHILLENEHYRASDKGCELVDSVTEEIPRLLRRAVTRKAQEVVRLLLRESEVNVEILPQGNSPLVRLRLMDGHDILFTLELLVPTLEQAERLEERFQSDAEGIYQRVLQLVFPEDMK